MAVVPQSIRTLVVAGLVLALPAVSATTVPDVHAIAADVHAEPAAARQPLTTVQQTAAAERAAAANRITVENRRPGTTNWRIPWPGKKVADDVNLAIKGYASATSVRAGQSIDLHITSTGAYTWHAYRLGYYQGHGGRLVATGSGRATAQPACPAARDTGTVACNWSRSAVVQTQPWWASGVYVVVLTNGNFQNYATFVVRDDRPGAILSLSPTNTYQAYNNFPDDRINGKSLYSFNSYGPATLHGNTQAITVSYDRPYARTGISDVVRDEAPFIQWAESRGYDMTYATDVDLHANPALASNAQAMWVPGHSEYWTDAMYEASKAARDAGTHQAFLGANNVFWRVRMGSNTAGISNRLMTCWKDQYRRDPESNPSLKSGQFRVLGKPEQLLLGQMYGSIGGIIPGSYPWVVTAANSWFYRGTGLRNGQSIPGLVGGETDYRHPGAPFPAWTENFVLSQSFGTTRYGGPGVGESALYSAPSGAWMFDAGSLLYTQGLGSGVASDARAEAMTTNLMARESDFGSRVSTQRIGGTNRFATSALTSAAAFSPGVPTVYLTTGLNFPDALAASAASKGQAPVLLVEPGVIRPEVQAELRRLAPRSVTVLGASETVSDAVLGQAAEITGAPATRLAGRDRFLTSALISRAAFEPGVPVLYVATGLNFPDALAAGAAGAQAGGPVLLTRAAALAPEVLAEIQRLRPTRIVVTGATDAVSEAVVTTLRQVAPTTRLAGSNRYETSRLIARDALSAGSATLVAVTTGLNFPDALSGGPMVARAGGSMVLVRDALDPAGAEEIVRNAPQQLVFLGTHPTVTNAVEDSAKALFDVVNGVKTPVVRDPAPPFWTPPATTRSDEVEPLPLEEHDPHTKAREELPWLDDRT